MSWLGGRSQKRTHLRPVDELPEIVTGTIELAPRPKSLDELHEDLLAARSRLVVAQGEQARAEQAVDDAEEAIVMAIEKLGINPKTVDRLKKRRERDA